MANFYDRYKVSAVKLKFYIVNKSPDYFTNVFAVPNNTTIWNPADDNERMNPKLAKW